MKLNVVFLVIAVVLFFIGMTSRWWPAAGTPNPYYPSIISSGLFFFALSFLWPMLNA